YERTLTGAAGRYSIPVEYDYTCARTRVIDTGDISLGTWTDHMYHHLNVCYAGMARPYTHECLTTYDVAIRTLDIDGDGWSPRMTYLEITNATVVDTTTAYPFPELVPNGNVLDPHAPRPFHCPPPPETRVLIGGAPNFYGHSPNFDWELESPVCP